MTILNEVVRSTLAASSGSQLSQKDLVSNTCPPLSCWCSCDGSVLSYQEVLELRIRNSIHQVKSDLLLLEKSTVATLRSENEVSKHVHSQEHSEEKVRMTMPRVSLAQALKAKMQKLKADLLVSGSRWFPYLCLTL